MSAGELNYRREHFHTASVPLVFDRNGRPCQLMILNTWALERDIATKMHACGKLMFANAVLWQFAFPAPQLDVLGTEVNWQPRGEYQPDSDAVMNFRRALCRQKPYCLLMNTDYARSHTGVGGALFPTLSLLWGLARLLRRGSRFKRPLLGFGEEMV
ncbi:MAG: hypothetical protein NT154_35610 [Verrucomicrobia bacterium]|nr:hypothetical protein [Verrucomicrobiota bacterium]